MNTLPTEARETPHLPFGMTAEELLDAVCPAPRRHHLDDQGEPVTRPGLTLRAARLLRVYPLLIDAFLGEPVRLSMHEADALLELVDAELAGDGEAPPTTDASDGSREATRLLPAAAPLRGARTLSVAAQPLRGAR